MDIGSVRLGRISMFAEEPRGAAGQRVMWKNHVCDWGLRWLGSAWPSACCGMRNLVASGPPGPSGTPERRTRLVILAPCSRSISGRLYRPADQARIAHSSHNNSPPPYQQSWSGAHLDYRPYGLTAPQIARVDSRWIREALAHA